VYVFVKFVKSSFVALQAGPNLGKRAASRNSRVRSYLPQRYQSTAPRCDMCVGIFLKPSPCCTCRLLLAYNFAQGTEAVPQETQEYGI